MSYSTACWTVCEQQCVFPLNTGSTAGYTEAFVEIGLGRWEGDSGSERTEFVEGEMEWGGGIGWKCLSIVEIRCGRERRGLCGGEKRGGGAVAVVGNGCRNWRGVVGGEWGRGGGSGSDWKWLL